jgi:hypothetical protein
MKIKKNYGITHKSLIITFITIIFGLLVGSGFYGYGNDYYAVYYLPNLKIGGWNDQLGYKISTLTIFDVHIGVHLVSGILALSLGILLKNFFIYQRINSIFFFITIYLLVLHTWPIIMSTSNAMRQGISMSLIFFSFAYFLKKENFQSFILIFLSIFTHKSGLIFLYIFFNCFFLKRILIYFKFSKFNGFIYLIYGLITFFLSVYLFQFALIIEKPSRIIYGDYRLPFFLINFLYILICSYKFKFLELNNINLFLFIFSSTAPSLLYLGLNWQYERLNMMVTIPYILVTSTLLTRKSSNFFLLFVFSLLLFLTFLNGMYKSLI